jgi:nitrite reductase (NADH) large subunit
VTDPRIYAVGECAAHRGIAYGLVAPLFEQGKVCATHLAQFGIGRYTGSQTSTKLKVTGIDLFSAGDFMGGEGTEEIVMSDPYGGVYKKLVIKDDKLVGACLYGDTVDGSWYFKLLRDGRSVSDIRDKLMFGESTSATRPRGPQQGRRDGRQRRGLRLQRRHQGHHLQGHQGQGPVHAGRGAQAHQGQRQSCGSCTGLVEQLLMATAGGDYSATPKKKAMCGCTDHGHQAVRDAIRAAPADHRRRLQARWTGARPTAAPAAARPSTTTCSAPGPRRRRTTRKAATSTSAATPTSRRTAPTA